MIGKAVFEIVSDTAFLLREEGELHLANGTKLEAVRNWYWHFDVPHVLEVTYDEAKHEPYHLLTLADEDNLLCGKADHLCGKDLYTGHYKLDNDRLEISQIVKGPAKNYEVSSLYLKQA